MTNNKEDIVNLTTEVDDIVDPWTVASNSDSGINYDKLIGKEVHKLK